MDALADQPRDRAPPGFPEVGDLRLQHAFEDQRRPAYLPDVLEGRSRRAADRFHTLAIVGAVRNDHARCILAEQKRVRPELRLQRHAAADLFREAHLRQRHGQAAVGTVVRGLEQSGAHRLAHGLLHRAFAREIEGRRHAQELSVHGVQVLAAAEVTLSEPADEADTIACRGESAARVLCAVVHQAHHPDHRRREDRLPLGLVVERHVAGDDGRLQGAAGIGDAEARLFELPHDLRALGIAEVQAVGDRDRLATDARDVARRLRHRMRSAEARVEIAPAGVASHRHRDPSFALAGEAHHRGIALSRANRRSDADHVVVLAVGPFLGGYGR